MKRLKVLITNIQLKSWTGTETYVRDMATGLQVLGHQAIAYSPELGEFAESLRAKGIPVVSRLQSLREAPDIIHGQHLPATVDALRQFPGTPAVYVMHDSLSWFDAPPRSHAIRRYLAVDEAGRRRLLRHGVPADRIRVTPNAVDLRRLGTRPPLPDRPRRALLFSNYITRGKIYGLAFEACRQCGITLDIVGARAGGICKRPERILHDYDIVLGNGLSALEALAVGAAVILIPMGKLGPMVTANNMERLRRLNFGRQAIQESFSLEGVRKRLLQYDPADAAKVFRSIRQTADLNRAVLDRVNIYREALGEAGDARASSVSKGDRISAKLMSCYRSASRQIRMRCHAPSFARWMLMRKMSSFHDRQI